MAKLKPEHEYGALSAYHLSSIVLILICESFFLYWTSIFLAGTYQQGALVICVQNSQSSHAGLCITQPSLKSGNHSSLCCIFCAINSPGIDKLKSSINHLVLNKTTTKAAFCINPYKMCKLGPIDHFALNKTTTKGETFISMERFLEHI